MATFDTLNKRLKNSIGSYVPSMESPKESITTTVNTYTTHKTYKVGEFKKVTITPEETGESNDVNMIIQTSVTSGVDEDDPDNFVFKNDAESEKLGIGSSDNPVDNTHTYWPQDQGITAIRIQVKPTVDDSHGTLATTVRAYYD